MTSSFAKQFEIAGKRIGGGAPCFVIAEAGVNHFGDVQKAKALVDMARSAGCDAVKFQHFSTDLLVGPSAPDWRERLRSKELSNESILEIRDYCSARQIIFLCTGHEEQALEFLVTKAEVSAIKVGSGEIENEPYLAQVGSYAIPVILSTGMYTLEQVRWAMEILRNAGCRELAILHCVTSYPTDPATVNLAAMSQIRGFFEGPVGYSDHTEEHHIPLAAVALGAQVLEKHITIDVDVPNAQDWRVSATPDSLPSFMRALRDVEAARGGWEKAPSGAELESIQWARKSLTFTRAMAEGAVVAREDLVCQRPGTGLPGSRMTQVVGRRLRRSVGAGAMVSLDMFTS